MSAVPQAPNQKRMALSAVTRGRALDAPLRILAFGVEGVGKTTFAAGAPDAVFLGPEDGAPHLETTRFPEPRTWQDLLDGAMELIAERHEFKSVVLDSLDWIEPLIWREVVRVANKADIKNIEDFGYGKGYTKALDYWRQLLSLLERMRKERKMNIVLLAHSQVRTWKNPEGDDFDRHTLKINDKAAGLCKEWCDAVLFMNYETYADKDSRNRVRGISTGNRLIYTERSAAFDAKNRYNLPATLPLSWAEFSAAIGGGPSSVEEIVKGIVETYGSNTAAKEWADKQIAKAPTDPAFLAKVLDTLKGKLAKERR